MSRLTQERRKTVKEIRAALDHLENIKFIQSRTGDSGVIQDTRTGRTVHEIIIMEDGEIYNGREDEYSPEELAYCVMLMLDNEAELQRPEGCDEWN